MLGDILFWFRVVVVMVVTEVVMVGIVVDVVLIDEALVKVD